MKHRSRFLAVPFLILFLAGRGTSANGPSSSSDPEDELSLTETATRAGLWIGAAVSGEVDDARMSAVQTHFNSITAENIIKWGDLAYEVGTYDFSQSDRLVDFVFEKGLRLRRHTLAWVKFPGSGHPDNIAELIDSDPDPSARM